MDKLILDWLLDGPAWVRFAVERQFLKQNPDVQTLLKDPAVSEILARLKDTRHGIPSIGSAWNGSDDYENPYWDLYFLADIGLTISELGLEKEIAHFLDSQSYNGTYMTEPGMEPNYHCKSAILLSSIARMGYQNNPHVQKYIQLMLSNQRLDQGWYCNPNHDIGAPFQDEPSCPQENLNILLLLGQYEEYSHHPRFNGAIDLLLGHWAIRHTGAQIVYFGIGRRYQSLQYPAIRYGILRVLDAISLYPYSFKKSSFHSMQEFVHNKAVDGKYKVEITTPYTDLEPADQPSRWLTFIVNRIDLRVNGSF